MNSSINFSHFTDPVVLNYPKKNTSHQSESVIPEKQITTEEPASEINQSTIKLDTE